MFSIIQRLTERRRHRKIALDAAVHHLEESRGVKVTPSAHKLLHHDEIGYIFRVAYGRTRPPHRAYFRVSNDTTNISQLSFDEVVQFGEKPWR
jgi:hypothetical protein